MRTHDFVKPVCRTTALLVSLLFSVGLVAQVPVYGCKDPTALNYSSLATIDNRSCTYQKKNYTPPVKVDPLSPALEENSGLQWAGDALWSFNDGGGAPVLFRLDTASNAILQTITIGGATNVDWEDIAFDGTYLYVGDVGNNNSGNRTDLKIYKFLLSAIPSYLANATYTIPAEQVAVIQFTYSDQAQPPAATGGNNTRFDCEAIIADGNKLHLFTKNWIDKTTTHYLINGTAAGTYVATPLETLATGYLVTAADKLPGSDTLILVGYQNSGLGEHFITLLSGFGGGHYFNGNARLISLPSAAEMGQVEGITFRNSSYGYLSNERFVRSGFGMTITVDQKLRTFNTAAFPSDVTLPLSLQEFKLAPVGSRQQVSWLFSEPVAELTMQYSTNGIDFTTVATYYKSKSSVWPVQPSAGLACYRLLWKEENGREKVSAVLCQKGKANRALANFILHQNGELHVLFSGNQPTDYGFRLLTTDGRTIAQTLRQKLVPGTNKISFAKTFRQQSLLLLQVLRQEVTAARLLQVE